MEIVEEILRQVIRRGKGIEINTTAGTLTEPLPSLEILKTYRRLGGEIVTTGSDAHGRRMWQKALRMRRPF